MLLKRLTLVLFACLCISYSFASAEDDAEADYDQLLHQWKDQLVELQSLRDLRNNTVGAERALVSEKYSAALEKGERMLDSFSDAAERRFLRSPSPESEEARFLRTRVRDLIQLDNFEAAARISRLLLENKVVSPQLYESAAVAAYMTHNFERAEEYLQQAEELGPILPRSAELVEHLSYYRKHWSEEQALREIESEADDLPRVRLTTSKGDIVVELFENEAPLTVANFIYLVEQEFYDGLSFHTVMPHRLAQTGCPNGDGTGGPGYSIPSECFRDGFRRHFRGSLGMYRDLKERQSNGSQFFLTLVPEKNMDGQFTVFGRIVEGMEVLSKLERRTPRNARDGTPDLVIKVVVERKRDHEYKPTPAGA